MVPKPIFGRFFSRYFSNAISASILGRFLEARNLKNSNFASTGARFLQNRRLQKRVEKSSMLARFLDAKATEHQKKIVLKICYFLSA